MRTLRRQPSCLPATTRLALTATALAVLALSAAAAAAATVHVAGPAGARVAVDGADVGALPLASPLTLSPGLHELVCTAPGRLPHRQELRIESDDEWHHITFRLLTYSRQTAILSNVVLAGLGQRYLGQTRRGWFYSAVEAGGLLTALVSEISRANANDEYLLALDDYHQAINQDDVVATRAAADAKLQDARDAADRRDLGLLAAAGAVGVSMLDAWLSFGHVAAGAGELPPGPVAGLVPTATAPGAFHTAVSLSF